MLRKLRLTQKKKFPYKKEVYIKQKNEWICNVLNNASRISALSIDMPVTTPFKDVKLKISCSVNRKSHIGTIDTFSRLCQVKQNVLVVIWKRRLRHIQVTTNFFQMIMTSTNLSTSIISSNFHIIEFLSSFVFLR